jgi:hypothetical protein
MDQKPIYEILKWPKDTEKLLSDPKQTAQALLTLKYGVFESRDISTLEQSLKAICSLLCQNATCWGIIDLSLMDRVSYH